MHEGDRLIERILYLGGTPNMQRLSPVRVGENAIEQHKLDLALELDAVQRYNRGVALAREKGDNGTKELLEHHLKTEESSVDWLESQLYLVQQLGAPAYLAEQMHE